MPNRVTANLVKAQAKLIAAFQSSELRFRYPATYLALKQNSKIMFPNYEELRKREDRTVETTYATRSKRALWNSRSHNHIGFKGDTAVLTPTWGINADVFNMSLKQADTSLFNAQEQMNLEIQNVISNFMEGFETQATAYLFANRSGVNIGTAEGTFDAVDKVFEIATANESRAIQISKINVNANKYPDGATVFCDSISYAKFEYQAAQGAQNNTNLSFQFNGLTYVHSVELGALAAGLVSAYSKGFWIIVPTGTVAVLPWIPIQNRIGVETKENVYTSLLNPVDGETYAVHSYQTRADDTGNNGYTQDVVTQYQISQDLAFAKAPLSTANETPILAYGIV